MAGLDMGVTSYPLKSEEIDDHVPSSIGNYALGFQRNNQFVPKYVGRSDTDLNKRLKDHVGEYQRFKFSTTTSAVAAWKKECKNYHDWRSQIGNKIHPARPEGKSKEKYPCPARSSCKD
jgi:hypothetical protein